MTWLLIAFAGTFVELIRQLVKRNWYLRQQLDATTKTLAAPPSPFVDQLILPPAPLVLPPEIPPDFCVNTNDGPSILERCFAPLANRTVVENVQVFNVVDVVEVAPIIQAPPSPYPGYVIITLLTLIFGFIIWYGETRSTYQRRHFPPPGQGPDYVSTTTTTQQQADEAPEDQDQDIDSQLQQALDDGDYVALQALLEVELRQLTRAHEAALSAAKTRHQDELNTVSSSYEVVLSNKETLHQNKVDQLTRDHDSALSDINTAHQANISEIQAAHTAEVTDLRAQVFQAQRYSSVLEKRVNDKQPETFNTLVDNSKLADAKLDAFKKSVDIAESSERAIRRASSTVSGHSANLSALETQVEDLQAKDEDNRERISHLEAENDSLRSQLNIGRNQRNQSVGTQSGETQVHSGPPSSRQSSTETVQTQIADDPSPRSVTARSHDDSAATETSRAPDQGENASLGMEEAGQGNDRGDDDNDNDDDDQGPSGPGSGAVATSGAVHTGAIEDMIASHDAQGTSTTRSDVGSTAVGINTAQDRTATTVQDPTAQRSTAQDATFDLPAALAEVASSNMGHDITGPAAEPIARRQLERTSQSDQLNIFAGSIASRLDATASVFQPTPETPTAETSEPADTRPSNQGPKPRILHFPDTIMSGHDEHHTPLPNLVSRLDQVPAAFQPDRRAPVPRIYQYNRDQMRRYNSARSRAERITRQNPTYSMTWRDTTNSQGELHSEIVVNEHVGAGFSDRTITYDRFIRIIGERAYQCGLPIPTPAATRSSSTTSQPILGSESTGTSNFSRFNSASTSSASPFASTTPRPSFSGGFGSGSSLDTGFAVSNITADPSIALGRSIDQLGFDNHDNVTVPSSSLQGSRNSSLSQPSSVRITAAGSSAVRADSNPSTADDQTAGVSGPDDGTAVLPISTNLNSGGQPSQALSGDQPSRSSIFASGVQASDIGQQFSFSPPTNPLAHPVVRRNQASLSRQGSVSSISSNQPFFGNFQPPQSASSFSFSMPVSDDSPSFPTAAPAQGDLSQTPADTSNVGDGEALNQPTMPNEPDKS